VPEFKSLTTIRLAVSLVYSAGRRLLLVSVAASVVTSVAIAGQLLVGRNLLNLLADEGDVAAGELAPSLIALGVLLLISAISQSVAAELRSPLSELVTRRAVDEILDVATEVELEAFEGAEFHDRLQRARAAASGQSSAVVFGLVTLVTTIAIAIGVVAVLLSVAPILVPFALLGYVPVALVNVRNNRARYALERDLTELQRRRSYLEYVLTQRSEAKEIRSYELAPTFRSWHDDLWDTRLAGVRKLVRNRLALATVGSINTTIV
jgi:ATP-binding cassette subfamily B protein